MEQDKVTVKSNKLISPVYGFSIEFPENWEITSRYRKLTFGIWGIERDFTWSKPDIKPKWNVIRGKNKSNTHVELQVHETEPVNTLESVLNTSSASKFLGFGEVIDHNPSIHINGISGFYVTRHCGNAGSILPAQIQEKLAFWKMRQYILHDGQYQYYIEAMWPDNNPAQRKTCEAIIASLGGAV